MLRVLLASVLVFSAAIAGAQAPSTAPTRILFIGNSYVSRPNLCARLEGIASAMNRPARCELLVHDDYSLADHWNDAKARDAIRKGWDYVVLQQGPSARKEGHAELLRDTRRFADAIRAAGAKPVVFSAWPALEDSDDFPAALQSARAAASAIDAPLIPAAEAWLRALQRDRRLRLYSDGLHATDLGGDLAVLATWFTLFPAGYQEFTEEYVTRIARQLRLSGSSRDVLIDAATRAVDEPMALK
jgi:hypothetical protein